MRTSLIVIGLMVPVALALAQEKGTQTGQTGNTQATTSEQSNQNTGAIKTQTYKGTLVDASCASGGAATTSSTATSSKGASSSADRSASGNTKNNSGEANRAGESGQSCAATANTTDFAIKTRDGRVLRFDAVGNERAKQEMTNRKKWANASAAGKSLNVTVSGHEMSDRLNVLSIH